MKNETFKLYMIIFIPFHIYQINFGKKQQKEVSIA